MIILIGLFASVYTHIIEEIDALLLAAQQCGVDTSSASEYGHRRYHYDIMLGFGEVHTTPKDR